MIDQKKSTLQERLYWREQFLNFTGETNLPHDYTRPLSWEGKYGQIEQVFSRELSEKFRTLTQNHPVSLLVLFSTAWSVLFHLYTGDADIVIATSGYKLETELKDNIVCLRVKIDPARSFKELLLHVKTTIVNAFKHQSLQYEDFLNEVGLKRKKNRSIPFSSILSISQHQTPPIKNLYRSDLFICFDIQDQIKMKFEYNSSLFHSESIDYLILHFNHILSTVIKNIEISIQDLTCLTSAETEVFQSNLKKIEGIRQDFPYIHQAFEEIVARYPDKVAIEHQNETISYKVLNEKANCIANHLIEEEKVCEGQFIGFIGERSIEYCIAILGILKAGCAFVPIDSTYPIKRMYTILEESGIKIVLFSPKATQVASSELYQFKVNWLSVDHKKTESQGAMSNPCRNVGSAHCAYMIYTSGSTGKPKGAVVTHEGKMNHILSSHSFFSCDSDFNCLFSASISSDISIWQALVALLCGGKTMIIDNETLFDYEKFWSYIEEKQVNVMQFVPTFIQAMLSQLEDCKKTIPLLSNIKMLILSGENIAPKLINSWFKYFKHVPILNAYGPTEASDIVSQQLFDSPIDPSIKNISIGTPLQNVALFILDHRKRIQPFYVCGEIYIAGIAVGHGYWNDESKSELLFIDNPFNQKAKNKWYRTGDYGRLLPDGRIEYMGRLDAQIKIRGFRAELGEIETCLLNSGLVKQCKLVLRIVNGNESLCAYLILYDPIRDQNHIVDIQHQLRDYLNIYLPEYMIPNYFHFFEQFPILPGGKIDFLNLPNPLNNDINKDIILPQNELDRKLVLILSDVIGFAEHSIGMQSNFFDLGGTSIHLMAVKYQIKEQMAVDVPIEQLFRMNTIQELADFVKGR